MPAEAEEAQMPEAERKPDAKKQVKKAKCNEKRLYELERKRGHSTACVAARKAAVNAGKSEVAIVNFSMRNYVSYGLRECAS